MEHIKYKNLGRGTKHINHIRRDIPVGGAKHKQTRMTISVSSEA